MNNFKLFRVLKEINNYFYIGKMIKKNRNTTTWKKHNLRVGYFHIIYSLINLPPEVFESEEQYYQAYIIEQLKPVNEYLATLNLQEIITLSVENKVDRENGVFAFGIKYIPLFRDFTLWWMIKWAAIGSLLWWAEAKFKVSDLAASAVRWVFHALHP
jgi:hypothetical protein